MPGPSHSVEELSTLPPRLSGDVLALAVRAAEHDGVRPLSEQTVLQARRLPGEADAGTSVQLVVLDRPGEHDARVLAYGHVDVADPAAPSGELVVDPEHRRLGLGGLLLDHVLTRWPAVRLWSHGDLPDARRLYTSRRLVVVRELWQMSRPLAGEWSELPDTIEVPDGFAVRSFVVGEDEQAWLEVNARAFATHAEQGRMGLTDLRERQAEPWFDPRGFIIIEDTTSQDADGRGRIAAFHWTKVERGAGQASGEVYVVGVDPDYQGRGLGRAVTLLGLQHLRNVGVPTATLYVDGDNAPAIATYGRLGFERSAVDVMYSAGAAGS